MKLLAALKSPFLQMGKIDKPLLALFLAINVLVLINSILHNPEIGYDGKSHLIYMRVLPYRLPTVEETREFFSPPLPYFLPSLLDKACLNLKEIRDVSVKIDDCLRSTGKFAQFINFILSLGVTFLFTKIAGVLRPDNRFWKFSSLALLGVMTVYYKTFAQVRGEPYVVFLTVLAIYYLSKMVHDRGQVTLTSGIGLGIILGLLSLSRQWGFMLMPAIFGLMGLVWIFDQKHRWQFVTSLSISFVVAFLVCGWFYLHLYFEHGSLLTFNRSPQAFSFSNQPPSFYRQSGLSNLMLFKSPTRPTFENQFFPILYSDVWGDYWGYFVYIQDRSSLSFNRSSLGVMEKKGNREIINPFLGRVNAVSIFPSLIFLAGILTSAASNHKLLGQDQEEKNRSLFYMFLLMFVIVSFMLYLYFLISYTMTDQDSTIKATYMLHVLIIFPLLGAEFLERVRQRKQIFYYGCMVALGLVLVHNLPAMITRYRMF